MHVFTIISFDVLWEGVSRSWEEMKGVHAGGGGSVGLESGELTWSLGSLADRRRIA